jgi:hypothetical protein
MYLTKRINSIIEMNIPKDMFPGKTTEEKLLAILSVWQDMRKSNLEYEQRFEKLFKDFEYTLNLLVIAEPTTSDESKQMINDWLNHWRELSQNKEE